MPRYLITLEAYVYAPTHEEAESKYHEGGHKAYVIQVDEIDIEDEVGP